MRTYISALRNKFRLFGTTLRESASDFVPYVGYVGRKNFGDDLLLDIYRRVSGRSVLPVLDTFRFQTKLRRPCVIGGGTILGGGIYLEAIHALELTPKRVFCAGVIPGEIDAQWAQALKGAEVYTRSIESCERMVSFGINARAFVDPALFCVALYDIKQESEVDRAIVLAVHGGHPYLDTYTDIVLNLTDSEKSNLVFFASSPSDLALCQSMRERLHGSIFRAWENLPAALYTLANAKFVISTRLHPAICAASYGTPFRVLAYDDKHYEFANSIQSGFSLGNIGANFTPILDDLRRQPRVVLSGVRKWHDRLNEFRNRFHRPL